MCNDYHILLLSYIDSVFSAYTMLGISMFQVVSLTLNIDPWQLPGYQLQWLDVQQYQASLESSYQTVTANNFEM